MNARGLLRSVLLVASVGTLGGCFSGPGDPDTGWCCNRPRPMPCEGCCSLIPDPVVFGHECDRGPACCPDLPGRLILGLRYSEAPLPGTTANAVPGPVLAAPAR